MASRAQRHAPPEVVAHARRYYPSYPLRQAYAIMGTNGGTETQRRRKIKKLKEQLKEFNMAFMRALDHFSGPFDASLVSSGEKVIVWGKNGMAMIDRSLVADAVKKAAQ